MITHSDYEAFNRVMVFYFEVFPKRFGKALDTEHLAWWTDENTDYECKNCGYTFAECICDEFERR